MKKADTAPKGVVVSVATFSGPDFRLDGLSGFESEQATLAIPVGRQRADSPKSSRCQLNGLTAREDGLDDVRCEESELKAAPDVAGVDAVPSRNLVDGSDRSGGQFLEPAMPSRDKGNQPGIDAGLGFVLPTHHQLRLHTAPLQPDGHRMLENLFRYAEVAGGYARDQADEFNPVDLDADGFGTQCDAAEETAQKLLVFQGSRKGREVGDGRSYLFDRDTGSL